MREDDFEVYLRNTNLSENTIASYKFAVKQYFGQFDTVTQKKLRDHKMWLIESYKPKTVNLRIRAINCYLDSIGKGEWKLQFVKVQQKAFLENVISEADYEYFKSCLKRDGELFWYFAVRFMAATGVRVSELIQIKAEHVQIGYMDLYSKGGKLRRIYIPKLLQEEALAWLEGRNQTSGFLFLNKQGRRITTRGVAGRSWPSGTASIRRWPIPIPSATGLPKAFWNGSMTWPCWRTLWDMRALRPPGSI